MAQLSWIMKRIIVLSAVALAAIVISPTTVSAETKNIGFPIFDKAPTSKIEEVVKVENKTAEPATPKPAPVEYTVVEGDNLSKISEAYQTTWVRIWNKNTNIVDPNLIFAGDKLVIPTADEVLADRALPALLVPVATAAPALEARGAIAGNDYTPGNCTWYVKQRRPDLPNNLGNANTWLSRAASQGFATGSMPRVGAVGWTGAGDLGHVVYVTAVSGGTITISEMNSVGLYVESSRTASAGDFQYIY